MKIRQQIQHPCHDFNGYSWCMEQEHNRASPFKVEILTKPGIKKTFPSYTPKNRIIEWVTKQTAQLKLKALLMPKAKKHFEDWGDLMDLSNSMNRRDRGRFYIMDGLSDNLDFEGCTPILNIPEANQSAAYAKRMGKNKSKSKYDSPYGP